VARPFEGVPLDRDAKVNEAMQDSLPPSDPVCDVVVLRAATMADTAVYWNGVGKKETDLRSPDLTDQQALLLEQYGDRLVVGAGTRMTTWAPGFVLPAHDCGGSP
jgi:hypothetical protein